MRPEHGARLAGDRELARRFARLGDPLEAEAVDLEREAVRAERLRAVGEPEMQVGARGIAAVAEQAEPLTGTDPLPDLDPPANVTFAGRVDMHATLQEHHVLLHCADREPWGLVLLEALASGRPVVAPAAGGPLEILDRGLYTPGDAEETAAKLREALSDPGRPRERAIDVRDSVARLDHALG